MSDNIGVERSIEAMKTTAQLPYGVRGVSSEVPAANWSALIDGATDGGAGASVSSLIPKATLSALVAEPSHAAASLSNGDGWPSSLFMFGGTNAADEIYHYAIHRVYKQTTSLGTQFIPILAAKGKVVLSSTIYGDAGAAFGYDSGGDTQYIADTITNEVSTEGVRIYSDANEYPAWLSVDFWGAEALLVEAVRNTSENDAATMDIFGAPADVPYSATSNLPYDTRAVSSAVPSSNWKALVDGGTSGATLIATEPQVSLNALVTNAVGDAASFVNSGNMPSAMFLFGGYGSADQTISYAVSRVYEVSIGGNTNFVAVTVATGTATLGSTAYGGAASALGASANLFADTITDDVGAESTEIYSPAGELWASICVEFRGAEALLVQTSIGTVTSADAFGCLVESFR